MPRKIREISVEASVPAPDDYLPLSGATNGGRKLKASSILAGDTPRQVANMLLFDGTSEQASATLPWSVAGQDLWFTTVVDWPTSLSANRCLFSFGPINGFNLFFRSADNYLYFRRIGGSLSNYRDAVYNNTLSAFGGQRVPVYVRLLADGTHEVWLNGQKLSEFSTATNGTPPAWSDDITATVVRTGHDLTYSFSGQIRPVKMGIGTWTDAQILKWAQTGIEPDWVDGLPGGWLVTKTNTLDNEHAGWNRTNSGSITNNSGYATFYAPSEYNRVEVLAALEPGYVFEYEIDIMSDNDATGIYIGTYDDNSYNDLTLHAITGSWSTVSGRVTFGSDAAPSNLIFAVSDGDKTVRARNFTLRKLIEAPVLNPAINPGDRVGADLTASGIPTLINGPQVVGNNHEHDEPIKLTVSHGGAGNLQFGGQSVLNTLRENAIESIIVTSDAAVTWSLGSDDGGEQYVSQISLSAAEQYVAPSDIVTYLLSGGALWSKSDGAADITISIKTRSR